MELYRNGRFIQHCVFGDLFKFSTGNYELKDGNRSYNIEFFWDQVSFLDKNTKVARIAKIRLPNIRFFYEIYFRDQTGAYYNTDGLKISEKALATSTTGRDYVSFFYRGDFIGTHYGFYSFNNNFIKTLVNQDFEKSIKSDRILLKDWKKNREFEKGKDKIFNKAPMRVNFDDLESFV